MPLVITEQLSEVWMMFSYKFTFVVLKKAFVDVLKIQDVDDCILEDCVMNNR